MTLTELPQEEWVQILTNRLQQATSPAEAEFWAGRLVKFHCQFTDMLAGTDPVFPELGPYSTTSIRELLKWTSRMQAHFRYCLLLFMAQQLQLWHANYAAILSTEAITAAVNCDIDFMIVEEEFGNMTMSSLTLCSIM